MQHSSVHTLNKLLSFSNHWLTKKTMWINCLCSDWGNLLSCGQLDADMSWTSRSNEWDSFSSSLPRAVTLHDFLYCTSEVTEQLVWRYSHRDYRLFLCLFYTNRCMLRPRSERWYRQEERGRGEKRLCSHQLALVPGSPTRLSQIASLNRFYTMIITHGSVVPNCLWSGAFCQRSSKNLASSKIRAKILKRELGIKGPVLGVRKYGHPYFHPSIFSLSMCFIWWMTYFRWFIDSRRQIRHSLLFILGNIKNNRLLSKWVCSILAVTPFVCA